MNYTTEKSINTNVQIGEFKKRYKIGEQVSLPFLHWKLELTDNSGYYEGFSHMVRFADFNSVVEAYKNVEIKTDSKGGAIMDLDLQGTNKARMVDYLNGTISVLMDRQLQAKNQFATNTIRFIDSTLVAMEGQLKDTENELKNFSKGKNIFEVEQGGEKYTDKISDLDLEKDLINRKISYYNSLDRKSVV